MSRTFRHRNLRLHPVLADASTEAAERVGMSWNAWTEAVVARALGIRLVEVPDLPEPPAAKERRRKP